MTRYIPDDRLDHQYAHHAPNAQVVAEVHDTVRYVLKVAAKHLNALVPEGPEKTTALNKLREAMFWANASVATVGNQDKIWQEDVSSRIAVIQHGTYEEEDLRAELEDRDAELLELAKFLATHYGDTGALAGRSPVQQAINLLSSGTEAHRVAHQTLGEQLAGEIAKQPGTVPLFELEPMNAEEKS